jgi:hypothetical protein
VVEDYNREEETALTQRILSYLAKLIPKKPGSACQNLVQVSNGKISFDANKILRLFTTIL